MENPLDDVLWAEISETVFPSSWWDALCPPDGQPVDVLVVPDGPIASLPLAVMPVRQGRPLIEYATVAMTPALSLLKPPSGSQCRRPEAERVAVVHIDDSDTGVPAAVHEAERWHLAARRMQVVTTADRHSLEIALRSSPSPDVVTISVHGFGDRSGNPQSRVFETNVQLRDGSILSAASALRLPWPETVILGACWISGVNIHAGREPFGFPLACLLCGASTVLGGIAPIPDMETARILGHIIDSLPGETNILAVLRKAQRAELRRMPISETSPAQVSPPGCMDYRAITAPHFSSGGLCTPLGREGSPAHRHPGYSRKP